MTKKAFLKRYKLKEFNFNTKITIIKKDFEIEIFLKDDITLFEIIENIRKETKLVYLLKNKYSNLIEIQEELITKNPFLLHYINNPIETVIKKAYEMNKNSNIFINRQKLKNLEDSSIIELFKEIEGAEVAKIKLDSEDLLRLKDFMIQEALFTTIQTEELIKKAINYDSDFYKFVKKQTEKLNKYLIQKNHSKLYLIKNQTNEIIDFALKKNINNYLYIRNKTEELNIRLIKEFNLPIKLINHQTKKTCFEHVKKDGLNLEFCYYKDLPIALAAVDQNIKALEFVDETIFDEENFLLKILNPFN